MDKKIRTFIAIALTEDIRNTLKKIQENFKNLDGNVRWVNPKNIHLTLKFLGNIPPKKLKSVTEIFPKLFKGFHPVEISITHLGVFPTPQRPRIIWAGIEKNAEQLTNMARQIENGLCKLGFPKEKRGFRPHLTLGRIRSGKNQSLLSKALKEYSFPTDLAQNINHVIIFKSNLTPQGPVYEALNTVEL